MLSRRDLLAAVSQGRHDTPVGDVMRRDFPSVAEGEMLDGTFQQIREGEGSTLPVVRDGRLVGIVTLEHVGEWMMIQSALRKARAPREAAAVEPAPAREIPATPIVLPDGPAGPAPP
jgi:CBS-domain-containing membrane protein